MEPVSVKDLSPFTISRSRGKEASRKIQEYLRVQNRIDVDLRREKLISSSFLDEVILRLKSSQLLDNVTFIFADDNMYQRFAQISALRNAQVYFKASETDERRLIRSVAASIFELEEPRRANSDR